MQGWLRPAGYLSILASRTRRVYRRQLVKNDQSRFVHFLDFLWRAAEPPSRFWPHSPGSLRFRCGFLFVAVPLCKDGATADDRHWQRSSSSMARTMG